MLNNIFNVIRLQKFRFLALTKRDHNPGSVRFVPRCSLRNVATLRPVEYLLVPRLRRSLQDTPPLGFLCDHNTTVLVSDRERGRLHNLF